MLDGPDGPPEEGGASDAWFCVMALTSPPRASASADLKIGIFKTRDPLSFASLMRAGRVPASASTITSVAPPPEPPPPAAPASPPACAAPPPPRSKRPATAVADGPPRPRAPPPECLARCAPPLERRPVVGLRALPQARGSAMARLLDASADEPPRPPPPPPRPTELDDESVAAVARRVEAESPARGGAGEIERRARDGPLVSHAGLVRTKDMLALPALAASRSGGAGGAGPSGSAAKKRKPSHSKPPAPAASDEHHRVVMIVGPIEGERQADVVRLVWSYKSRSVVPRAAWGELVAAWFSLGLYADLAAIFGSDVGRLAHHDLVQTDDGDLWLVERSKAPAAADVLDRYRRALASAS